ncbi:MAG: peroxidase family protein [Thiotrichaceae bacterium]
MQINSTYISTSLSRGISGRRSQQQSLNSISSLLSTFDTSNPRRNKSRYQQPDIHQFILKLLIRLIKQLIDQVQNKKEQYRTFDGTNNNTRHPKLGSTDQPLRNFIPKDVSREIGGATEARLPSAREVSNVVANQQGDTVNRKGLSDMFWLWGQFLDHDINLTHPDESKEANINVPTSDPFFDPQGTGQAQIGFHRSGTLLDKNGTLTQPNAITAYIDGSNIYGSDKETADKLRSFSGGRLDQTVNGLLPQNEWGQFVSGDVRVNEHAGLSAMHTLWMREHNRVADKLSKRHPRWSDEKIFQEARNQVVAQMQAISYNEFVPQLLGKNKIGRYSGYNPNLSPQISNSFSTAAYRLGHTMLSSNLLRLDEEGNEIAEGHLSLRNAFFNPDKVREAGIDPILRGFASQTAQAVDPMIIDDVRNFLFGQPGQGGFDLAALNTQRGRDHGLASLNDSREALGLSRINSFNDPIWQGDFGQKLAQVYDSPDDVDLWIGGLAEKHDGDSLVGETFTRILNDQFTRLRSADSFWYERQFSRREISKFNNTTLADVIKRNTDIQTIQDDVLVAKPRGATAVAGISAVSILAIQAPATIRTFSAGDAGVVGATGAAGLQATQPQQPAIDAEQEQRLRDAFENGLFG